MSLDRYILRQCLLPFLISAAVATALVWMTQSLQRADLIVKYGQGLGTFLRLSLLIVPSLLAVILPFALFAGALYALQRLHADSEIAVMYAAGVSRLRIAAPLFGLAAACAGLNLWINLDLMPSSYRVLKSEVAEIRADFASVVLKSGGFASTGAGFTIYTEKALSHGRFIGLLINDWRDPQQPQTYMARAARLLETPAGSVLQLLDGNIQRPSPSGYVDVVEFDSISLNIDAFASRKGPPTLELTERYLSELLHPDMSASWDSANADRLIAEGHGRLATPLYAFAFIALAMAALTGGPYSRRGYALRIVAASAAAAVLRVAGVIAQAGAANTGAVWLIYAVPIGGALVSAAVLLARPAPKPAPAPI